MEQGGASRYWCHMCSQTVNPITESEAMECPVCGSGFIEEMPDSPAPPTDNVNDHALSLWAPILLGLMARPLPESEPEPEAEDDAIATDADQQLESLMRRRRTRNSTAILQLLHTIRAGMAPPHPHPNPNPAHNQDTQRETETGDGQRVILINQTLGSLGDYIIGPGLDLLLQHLSDNDPNRYGTPPAQKDLVDALPFVTIHEPMQCAVCLDECEEGAELKEMPCKHKFHDTCILPWLQLHSSCPVCRHQLPADESTTPDNRITDNGTQFSVPLLWPFTAFFSPSQDASSATADHDD